MPGFDVELSGYRLFAHDAPLTLRIDAPMTAVFGAYRSGKAAALKWMYELRGALSCAADSATDGAAARFPWPKPLREGMDVFCTRDPEPVIRLVVRPAGRPEAMGSLIVTPHPRDPGEGLAHSTCHDRAFRSALGLLAGARFYGGFRSALNVDADLTYYDLNRTRPFRYRVDLPAARLACKTLADVFEVDVHPIASDDELAGLRVGGREFPWPAFGSGLTQFFAVAYHALVESASLILIEEPELHVDAHVRGRFLSSLGDLAESGVIFATSDRTLATDVAGRVITI
jgi:hypothetical protein